MIKNAETEADYIARAIRSLERSLAFFSSANQAARDLWVVNEFLENLELPFSPDELKPVRRDPPDVIFRDAQFEVKEILDPERRRGEELKASLTRARAAKTIKDLGEDRFEPLDVAYSEVLSRIQAKVKELVKNKYAAASTRRSLDLLFYVNLSKVFGFLPSPLPSNDYWHPFGFRSISMVLGRGSAVLAFASDASAFLQDGGVRMKLKPRPCE